MGSSKMTVTEAARNFSEIVNRAHYRGERFVLMKSNKPVAEIGPVHLGKKLSELPDLIKKMPRLTEIEADDFMKDIQTARDELANESLRDPWES
jgi:antitoxin (DNA-binding transcriptional repressor) of toxin-antitoxin stability system